MGTAVVITSGKGGTGKTTAAAAIASCLAALGRRTLCLDADMVLKNLDLSLGLSDRAVMSFYDILEGRCSIEDAAVAHPDIENLYFLTAPVNIPPEKIDLADMRDLVSKIKTAYDYCIIDSPAGLGPGFELAVASADSAIVITTADDSSCRDAQRAVSELSESGIKEVRLIVNRVKRCLLKRAASNIDNIIDIVGARLIGLIPEDDDVPLSANMGSPLVLFSSQRAAKAFLHVAMRMEGRKIPL